MKGVPKATPKIVPETQDETAPPVNAHSRKKNGPRGREDQDEEARIPRKKRKGSLKEAAVATMGKDTKTRDLSPNQAGAYAFLIEYVRTLTHTTWPQDPPVQAFFYPGRGDTDACRMLHKM